MILTVTHLHGLNRIGVAVTGPRRIPSQDSRRRFKTMSGRRHWRERDNLVRTSNTTHSVRFREIPKRLQSHLRNQHAAIAIMFTND